MPRLNEPQDDGRTISCLSADRNVTIAGSGKPGGYRMIIEYTVGLRLGQRSEALTIEAEDALIAALKVKCKSPEAMITYVRKSNRRGDRRHPHHGLADGAKK
jgi:hypothetical protein